MFVGSSVAPCHLRRFLQTSRQRERICHACHTAKVGRTVTKAHEPAADVKRLLAEKKKLRGLAAPGMPASAPGMDLPGEVPYLVHAIGKDGTARVYARH